MIQRLRPALVGLAAGCLVLGLLVLVAAATGVLWLRSASGQVFVRHRVEQAISERLVGAVEIGVIRAAPGTWLGRGLELRDVVVRDAAGQAVMRADVVALRYDLLGLLLGRQRIATVALRSPVLDLVERPGGALNVTSLVRATARPPTPLVLEDLRITDGRIRYQPRRGAAHTLSAIDAAGTLRLGERRRVELRALSGRYRGPAGGERAVTARGAARWEDARVIVDRVTVGIGASRLEAAGTLADGRVDLGITRLLVAPAEARWLFPALSPAGPIRASGQVSGPPERLRVDLDLVPVSGTLALTGRVNVKTRAARLEVRLGDVRWPALRTDAPNLVLSGRAWLDARIAPDGLRGALVLEEAQGHLGAVPFTAGTLVARLEAERTVLDRYRLELPGGVASGEGYVSDAGAIRLRFRLAVEDAGRFQPRAGWPSALAQALQPFTAGSVFEGRLAREPGAAPRLSLDLASGSGASLGPPELPRTTEELRRELVRRVFGRRP